MKENDKLSAIVGRRVVLQNPYAFLAGDGQFDGQFEVPATGAAVPVGQGRRMPAASKSWRQSIEEVARDLQRDIYIDARGRSDGELVDPIHLLDPAVAAHYLGVEFTVEPGLGSQYLGSQEIPIAGQIDRRMNRISLSRRLKGSTHRFTGAHEVGHWVLHPGEMFHRDRPLDAPSSKLGRRSLVEVQADYFAAFFLMPRKLLTERFLTRFGVVPFAFSVEQAFGLDPGNYLNLINGSVDLKNRARLLADAQQYQGNRFHSLADEFGVSIGAMAIQLVDLGLVV